MTHIKLDAENKKSQPLFLLPQQIDILEDTSKNIIIYGAPGTGKTLLVMMKALQWSKEEREGKVVVEVRDSTNTSLSEILWSEQRRNGRRKKANCV